MHSVSVGPLQLPQLKSHGKQLPSALRKLKSGQTCWQMPLVSTAPMAQSLETKGV